MTMNESLPRYFQIVNDIKDKIEKGELQPGDRLPTENEFTAKYAVSRVTVHNAMKYLVNTGLVERKPNVGHFVAKIMNHRISTTKARSLYQTLAQSGIEPSSIIISMDTEKAPANIAKILERPEDSLIIVIRRIRCANGKPFAEEYIYLPDDIFRGINVWKLEHGSLIEMIEKDYGIEIAYSTQTLKAETPKNEQKESLKISSNQPLLVTRSKLVDKKGRVIKYTKTYIETSIVEYSFTWES